MYMAEWSPDPSLDPLHPGSWAWGNPALGYTLDMDTIRQESTNPDRASFLRASLNLWVSVVRGWIEPGRWPSLEYTGDVPKRWGRGDRVFAGRLPVQRDQMRQPVRRSGARHRRVHRRVNYRAVGERAGTCQRPHDQVCFVANRGRNMPTKHRAPQGRGRLCGTRTVYTASQKHDRRSATVAHGRKTVGRTRPARRCRTHRQHHRAVKQTIAWAYRVSAHNGLGNRHVCPSSCQFKTHARSGKPLTFFTATAHLAFCRNRISHARLPLI
jgi:hypothetical protein